MLFDFGNNLQFTLYHYLYRMRASLFVSLVVCLTLASEGNSWKASTRPGGKLMALQDAPSHPSTVNCTWKYFSQPLDHFSPGVTGEAASFQQRYCIYDKYFSGQPDAPVLFYTGNESPVEEYINGTGLMWTLGPKLKGLIVFAEHRYFGESVPKLQGVRNCLAYCTSQQALADHAMLAIHIRATWKVPDAPVIAFGGSYGGMLAAWARIKYPNVFAGSIAASAPLWGYPLLDPPVDGASRSITRAASAEGGAAASCKTNIFNAYPLMFDIGKTKEGLKYISEKFGLCKPLETQADLEAFIQYAQAPWFLLAEGDYPFASTYITYAVQSVDVPLPPWAMRVACKHLDRDDLFGVKTLGNPENVTFSLQTGHMEVQVEWDQTSNNKYTMADVDATEIGDLFSGFKEAIGVWYNVTGKLQCFDGSAEVAKATPPSPKKKKAPAPGTDGVCTGEGLKGNAAYWDVICCNENLNLVNTVVQGNGNDMYWPPNVPRNWTMETVVEMSGAYLYGCNEQFAADGLYGVPNTHDPWALWDTTYYGGKDITRTASNIVFSNGLLDPWSHAGVLTNYSDTLTAVVIPFGGHHLDLFFPTDTDPEGAISARIVEESEIRKWIKEATNRNANEL